MKLKGLIALAAATVAFSSLAAFSMDRPYSIYEQYQGQTYNQIKKAFPALSEEIRTKNGTKAFAFQDLEQGEEPAFFYGPLYFPDAMFFFQEDKLMGCYSFLDLGLPTEEAYKNSREYKGFVLWADSHLEKTPKGWNDKGVPISIGVDELNDKKTLGIWWGIEE